MNSTKKNPKLNVRLLRRIQKHILEEPRRFFMDGVAATGTPGKEFSDYDYEFYRDLPDTVPPCGTAACIHGWTALLSGKTVRQAQNLSLSWSVRKLGLPGQRFGEWNNPLFVDSDWPEPFQSQYAQANSPDARAKIACARIDHLIKTGK